MLFHQKKYLLLPYLGDHLSNFLTFDIPSVENFASKFTHHSSWTTNSMYHFIHWLDQQNAIWLHGTKKVLISFWLWNVVWLHSQTQMGFYLQFWLSGECIYVKAKMNNLKTPTNSEHRWSTATKELPLMSHMLKLFLNTLKTPKTPLAFPSYQWKHACLHWIFCKKDYQYGLPWSDNNHCPFNDQTW